MNDIERLENRLKKIGKVPVSSEISENIKGKLFLSIQKPSCISRLISRMREVVLGVDISVTQKARIKEHVLSFASSYSKSRFLFSRFFMGHKKAWASLIVFVFVLNMFVFVDGGVLVAEAKDTILREVQGDVYVSRGEERMNGKENFILEEGDVIQTGAGSKAVIRFFDESVSRLYENTEVVLDRLFLDDSNELSDVVVGMKGGKFWSKVCYFAPRHSEFTVMSSDVLAQASNGATFNVSTDGEKGEFKVDVFENAVDVHLVSDYEVITESVSEGSSAKVESFGTSITVAETLERDDWIAENLSEDEKHIFDIASETIEEISDEAGVLPENILHPIKRMKEDAHLLLTFDEVERAKVKLEISEKRLLEAEVLTAEGETLDISQFMADFQTAADEFSNSILVLKETDLVGYVDLTTYLKRKLNKHKRNLLFVQPDSEVELVVPEMPLDEVLDPEFIKPLMPEEEVVEEDSEVLKQAAPNLNIYIEGQGEEDLESHETEDNS